MGGKGDELTHLRYVTVGSHIGEPHSQPVDYLVGDNQPVDCLTVDCLTVDCLTVDSQPVDCRQTVTKNF